MMARSLRLIDGPLVVSRECRTVLVQRMAADLIRLDSFRDENDAVRSLIATEKYSAFDIVRLIPDAQQVAQQEIVAAEISRP